MQKALRQPDAAHLGRHGPHDIPGLVPHDELSRTATDVNNNDGPLGVHIRCRAKIRQASFFRALDHFRNRPRSNPTELGLRHGEEIIPVRRIPRSRRRNHTDSTHAMIEHHVNVSVQRNPRPLNRSWRQLTRTIDALAETNNRVLTSHLAHNVPRLRIDVGNEQADGIGTAIHGSQKERARDLVRSVARFRRMSLERRTGSHGQTNPQFLYRRPLIRKGSPAQLRVVGQRQSDTLGAQANGVRPLRQSVSHENVQALHPVRHSAAGKGGSQILNAVANTQVVFVRSPVIGGQDLIGFQPLGHPFHDPSDFESRRLRR